jgi:tRNA pseudouridine38-40 synthase
MESVEETHRMSTRLKLTVSYNGAPWQGWQSQPGAVGVQDQLEKAISSILKAPTTVHGSGRTDAGVHALAQVAHFDAPTSHSRMTPENWVRAINTQLPRSIRVMACATTDPSFHARFSATGKTYLYRIHRGDVLPPLEVDRAWHIFGPLDETLLQDCAHRYVGRHNFARLSANRGDMDETTRRADMEATTRSIYSAQVHRQGDIVEIRFHGEGFMYKMVRLMVGALVHIARGRAEPTWLTDLLTDAQGEKNHHCAPADGLYLESVDYEEGITA